MPSTKAKPADAACRADGPMNTERPKYMSQEMGQLALAESAPLESQGLKITNLDELKDWCRIVASSQLAPKGLGSPHAIFLAVQCGMELGLGPAQALQSIAVINNKPTIYGDTALGLVKRHKDFLDHIEPEPVNGVAKVTSKRKGCSDITRTYSVEDAKRAGLWGKSGPWTTNPNRMLQLRARSFALRDQFPDVLRGVGIAEEVRDYTPRNVTTRRVAEAVVLPDAPTTAEQYFDSAVKGDDSQRAALNDKATGDLFAEVSK